VSGPILVGYDGHEAANRALARGLEVARDSGQRLVVLAVYEMPLDPSEPQYFGTLDDSRPLQLPSEPPPAIASVLARAKEEIGGQTATAELAWAAGDPADEIMRAARERNASLIVVGSHHHSLLGRFFGADVADSVRADAGCEVEVV
jgi:nucleotide-binding universal stress UspA family protein